MFSSARAVACPIVDNPIIIKKGLVQRNEFPAQIPGIRRHVLTHKDLPRIKQLRCGPAPPLRCCSSSFFTVWTMGSLRYRSRARSSANQSASPEASSGKPPCQTPGRCCRFQCPGPQRKRWSGCPAAFPWKGPLPHLRRRKWRRCRKSG